MTGWVREYNNALDYYYSPNHMGEKAAWREVVSNTYVC